MSFWQRLTRFWQQLDQQLQQAAIIYVVFAICAILLQVFFNIAEPRADEAIAVITAEAGDRSADAGVGSTDTGARSADTGARSASGAMHKVDLTDLCLALDQELVDKLGFERRSPGMTAIPAYHSWQIAVRNDGDVEWHWIESSHQYDLSEMPETSNLANVSEGSEVSERLGLSGLSGLSGLTGLTGLTDSATGRSVEDLRQAVMAVKEHWTEDGGREVAESFSRENGMMILNLELKMKPAEEERTPSLTMSKLQIKLKDVAGWAALVDAAVAGKGEGDAGSAEVTGGAMGADGDEDAGDAGDINAVDPAKSGETQSASGAKPGAGKAPDKIPMPGSSIGDQPGRPIRPKICIILDDGGEATPEVAEEFWKLNPKWPLALAVLPFSPYSREQAEMAKSLGYEVLLHLPMEPLGSENPGAGAILTELSDAEIRERVQAALAAVPQAIGVNNHMGSKASSDPRVMQLVLSEIRRNNLFFVDSVSIASTVGYQEALRMGVPTARRHVFIDNLATEEAVLKQLEELVRVARSKGTAIGIGHFNRVATARALARFLPQLEKMGIDLVPLTELIK